MTCTLRPARWGTRLVAAIAGVAINFAAASATADRLEPGLQGQTMPGEARVLARPYARGVRAIGHEPLMGRDSNIQLAWSGNCAYVASTPPNLLSWGRNADPSTYGVAVIDVRNPRAPRQVGLLRDGAAIHASESLHAIEADDRKLLAAGPYAISRHEGESFTELYDVSDCARPRHVARLRWPYRIHTLTFSPDGKRLYGTHHTPDPADGGLVVFDIADITNPRLIGQFAVTRPDGTSFGFDPHEISISPDEKRIYAGVMKSADDDLNIGIDMSRFDAATLTADTGGIYILDNSDLVAGKSNPAMRLIGALPSGGWHSVMRARIGGVPYLVGGGELGLCPASWPKLVDISDETTPVLKGQFRLAMNHRENCPPLSETEKRPGGFVGDPGTAQLHFNDVDAAEDTRLGLFNFMWAGLRIVDLRQPEIPVEIAYFKPGDGCSGHVRYRAATGEIWLACQASGFHVLKLDAATRRKAGLLKIRYTQSR